MKINSHCWLRTALQRLQCIFIILWKYSNKRRTAAVELIGGWRLLTFPAHVWRLIEGGAYSGTALIRVNTVSNHMQTNTEAEICLCGARSKLSLFCWEIFNSPLVYCIQ